MPILIVSTGTPAATTPPSQPVAWHPSAVAPLLLDASTLTGANGSAVSSWPSTGSNTSLVATQSTGANQPTLSVAAQGGQNLVHFNNANSNAMTVAAMPFRTDKAVAFIGLFNGSSSNWGMMMVLKPASGGNWETEQNSTGTIWSTLCPSGGALSSVNSFIGWHLIEYVKRVGDRAIIYTDASIDTSDLSIEVPYATNPVVSPGDFWLGTRPAFQFPYLGDMAAVAVVDADLADPDRQRIEGWMAWKWGLASILPAWHPFKTGPPMTGGTAPPTGAPFVTSFSGGATRSGVYWAGFRFIVGSKDIMVTALGRMMLTGNTRAHPMNLLDSTGNTVLATTTIVTSGATVGTFLYQALITPVRLTAGQTYHVLSSEGNGDSWYDNTGTLITTADATGLTAAFTSTSSGSGGVSTSSGQSYVPLNFQYYLP